MIDDTDTAAARVDIIDRLDSLEHRLATLDPAQQRREVHSLKGVARAFGFEAVAILAHALESEIDGFGRAAVVTAYLDAMHAAADLPPGPDAASAERLLATVRARLTPA